MSKYGLQLRVKPQQKKQPTRPPLPKPPAFDDDDDDNVEREIMRQAHKNKTHRDVEEQHKKALEEDPSAFDYDGVYDQMKEKQIRPKELDRQDRKPRYIQVLIDKAKQREREHEIIYERQLAKERSQDEHLYADKDKFVTSAYKKKLAEQAKWMEEERLRELREERDDVTKKTDISDFYFNLAKNVAFGAQDADKAKSKKQHGEVSPIATGTSTASPKLEQSQKEISEDLSPKEKSSDIVNARPISDTSPEDRATNEQSASKQPRIDDQERTDGPVDAARDDQEKTDGAGATQKDYHKRSEDAVAAAKQRFLARKKSKVQ